MSIDYAAVLGDLRAKRDALDNLIAALENVAGLMRPQTVAPTLALPRAEKAVRPSVRTRTVPRVKAKPTRRETGGSRRRDTARDGRIVELVTKAGARGVPFGEIHTALGAPPRATLAAALATLVAEKQLARHGEGRGSRYFPAGTTAKEAL